MASGTFYPVVSGDDGYFFGTSLSNNSIQLFIGNTTGNSINIFIRFPNVTIPAGAAISEAYIRFTSINTQSNTTLNENCYFNDIDNAVAPTNIGEANALALTSAITWNNLGTWVDDVQYDTPELKTILQTVISRGGW